MKRMWNSVGRHTVSKSSLLQVLMETGCTPRAPFIKNLLPELKLKISHIRTEKYRFFNNSRNKRCWVLRADFFGCQGVLWITPNNFRLGFPDLQMPEVDLDYHLKILWFPDFSLWSIIAYLLTAFSGIQFCYSPKWRPLIRVVLYNKPSLKLGSLE